MTSEPVVIQVKKTPDARRSTNYVPRTQGQNTGMGICEFWVYLFELNEKLPKGRKMTDEEIKRQMWIEFPERKSVHRLGPVGSKGDATVNENRQLYNRGRFTRGVPPTKKSRRYGIDGSQVNPRTGKPIDIP